MGAPRITYVTAGFPFPLSSGYLRHHHFIRALAPDHEIRLRSLVGAGFDDAAIAGVSGLVADVRVHREPVGSGTARTLRRLRPERRTDVMALRATVAADLADGIDVVVLSGKETASVLDVVGGRVPVVVDLCDATSARVTQEMRTVGPRRAAGLALRRHALRRIEHRLVVEGDVLLTASARDKELLEAEGAPPAVGEALVVPNGIDLDHWRRQAPCLGEEVVLCGNLGYRPNADAAVHLVEDVMPHVWDRMPDARLTVVGLGASAALVRRLARPAVTLTGAVPDVRPHLERAAVVAAPLRIATGIQNKLLEALAMEIPVVTSSVAAAGLGRGAPVAIADDPRSAAAAVVACLRRASGGAATPDAAARAWVGERFDWAVSGRLVASAIATATAGEHRSGAAA
ncbi:glycosyltransferase [Iamia sp. SCSIO 61187]|uniref:glycosyltransferase n=1 Tax=Iamia sp. SCSIO 61187 TaxID=2722752 RepID=UPI001C627D18|nr:glycosyltransferase [Iamia sp. SCSIO 61187]QYG92249.1 glycosyltransferase [Iamia sp. SCSIO 61187]